MKWTLSLKIAPTVMRLINLPFWFPRSLVERNIIQNMVIIHRGVRQYFILKTWKESCRNNYHMYYYSQNGKWRDHYEIPSFKKMKYLTIKTCATLSLWLYHLSQCVKNKIREKLEEHICLQRRLGWDCASDLSLRRPHEGSANLPQGIDNIE